ncbi:MAG: response regulator [Ignavibacteriaceae bacterium]
MAKIPDFILFDDDPVNNTLCHITIRNTFKDAKIKTFTIPVKGFHYISTEFDIDLHKTAILFLDINMKGMTCWEFLEEFEQLDEKIRSKFKIFILSASLNPADKERAADNKNVVSYIEKPLTKEKIINIVNNN